MKRFFAVITISFFGLLLSTQLVFSADKPTVFVSIVPQKFFVQQIAKDDFNVEIMVQPGAEPETYEPKPSQMRKLASSSAYFAIGVPFEHAWLNKIVGVNPEMTIVHTEKGITKLPMTNDLEKSSDNPLGLDPHIWLSPLLVKKQAATIAASLAKILPEKKVQFQQNFDVFAKKIDALNDELKSTLKGNKGMKFMVYHPAWGYFAHDYDLEQIAIEIEGKEPKPAQLADLILLAEKDDIHAIFVQPQFSTKDASVVAREIKGVVTPADPLAEDWLSNMRVVADTFKKALR